MKIIFLEAVQNYGGARRSTVELAARLNEHHNVEIIDLFGSCIPFKEAAQMMNLPLKVVYPRKEPILASGGKTDLLSKIPNYLKYTIHFAKIKKQLKQMLLDSAPDIIIVNNTKTLSLLSSGQGYQIAYFARGWSQDYELGNWGAKMVKRLATKVMTVSHATRHTMITRGISTLENTFVVPNAIEVPPSLPKEQRKGLMVCGGFLPSKGHHIAVEVLQVLKEKGIAMKLSLVGPIYVGDESKQYFEKVKKQVQQYKLEEAVEFAIDVNNVTERMSRASYLLHPSKTEGLPRVIMESMAYGSLVIANAVGGVTDFIDTNYNGVLVHHNNVKEYVKAIERLMSDEPQRTMLRANAFDKIRIAYTKQGQLDAFLSAMES